MADVAWLRKRLPDEAPARAADEAPRRLWFAPVANVPPLIPAGALRGPAGTIPRLPAQDDRTQRFSQVVGDLLNSLLRLGYVVQTGPQTYALSTTGAQVTSSSGTIVQDADAGTVIFDLNLSNQHTVTLGGNRSLDVRNPRLGQRFWVNLVQDATGGRKVIWWPGVIWPDGKAPVLRTAAGAQDGFSFQVLGAGSYLAGPLPRPSIDGGTLP